MENEANGFEEILDRPAKVMPQEWGPITADGLKMHNHAEGLVEFSAVNVVAIAADAAAQRTSIARTLLVCSTAASQAAALFAMAATFSAEGNNDARDAFAAKAANLVKEICGEADGFSDE